MNTTEVHHAEQKQCLPWYAQVSVSQETTNRLLLKQLLCYIIDIHHCTNTEICCSRMDDKLKEIKKNSQNDESLNVRMFHKWLNFCFPETVDLSSSSTAPSEQRLANWNDRRRLGCSSRSDNSRGVEVHPRRTQVVVPILDYTQLVDIHFSCGITGLQRTRTSRIIFQDTHSQWQTNNKWFVASAVTNCVLLS